MTDSEVAKEKERWIYNTINFFESFFFHNSDSIMDVFYLVSYLEQPQVYLLLLQFKFQQLKHNRTSACSGVRQNMKFRLGHLSSLCP